MLEAFLLPPTNSSLLGLCNPYILFPRPSSLTHVVYVTFTEPEWILGCILANTEAPKHCRHFCHHEVSQPESHNRKWEAAETAKSQSNRGGAMIRHPLVKPNLIWTFAEIKIPLYCVSHLGLGLLSHRTKSVWTPVTVPSEPTLGEAPFKLNLFCVCGKSEERHVEVQRWTWRRWAIAQARRVSQKNEPDF